MKATKLSSLIVVTVLISVWWSFAKAQEPNVPRFPRIGDRMPCVYHTDSLTAISPSQFAVGCTATTSGIRFFLATIDSVKVSYVSTKDPMFKTSEGIHVGSNWKDVESVGESNISEEASWAYISKLPSGWYVKYGGLPGIQGGGTLHSQCDSVVYELFQRAF